MTHSGAAARAMGRFQQKLQAWNAKKVVYQILAQWPTETIKNEFEGVAVFQDIVEGQGQIVFNWLDEVVKGFSLTLKDFKGASALVESLTQSDGYKPTVYRL